MDVFALPLKQLKGTDPVDSLDFSRKKLGVASAIVISALIGVNASLTADAKQGLRNAVKDRDSFELNL